MQHFAGNNNCNLQQFFMEVCAFWIESFLLFTKGTHFGLMYCIGYDWVQNIIVCRFECEQSRMLLHRICQVTSFFFSV